MGVEAESYRAEDDVQTESIEARNLLENFGYQVVNIVESSLGQHEQRRQGGEQECVEDWN